MLPALLLAIPSIQNIAIDKAAVWASDYLGTTVKVGQITVGMLNRVAVRDFYVEDYDGDTLLYVKRADAYFGSWASLAKKHLVINYGNVQGGKVVVRDTERGVVAIKEVTDKLKKKEKRKGGFRLDIYSLKGSDIDFVLRRNTKPREAGIDFGNMRLLGINVDIDNFAVDKGAVLGDIRKLSFVERSGFELENLSGKLFVHLGKVEVKEGEIRTAHSKINLDQFLLNGENWAKYKDFIKNIPIICSVTDSYVSSEDIGYFAPAIWNWRTSIRNATLSMNGPIADFNAKATSIKLEDGGILQASAHIKGLKNVEKTKFDIKVGKLSASTEELTYLLHNIANLSLSESATEYVKRLGRVDLMGEFHGSIRDFRAKAKSVLQSGGLAELECSMKNPAEGRKGVVATISAEELDLEKILAKSLFGKTTFTANIEAEFGDEKEPKIESDVAASSFGFNGHNYENVGVVVNMEDELLNGSISTNDKALMMNAQMIANISEPSAPLYDATMLIEYADLHEMNINRRDSISILRADVGLSARGTSLDDMNGVLQIAGAEYETIGRRCSADVVELAVRSNEDARTMTLTSDFADIIFESRTTYKNALSYLKDMLVQYIPMYYDDSTRQKIDNNINRMGNDVAVLSFVSKKIDPLLGCITDGLEMAEGSKLEMLLNPSINSFKMRASSEYLMHHNYLAANINVAANNESDSLAVSLTAEDLYAGMLHLSGVEVKGGARDNSIDLDAIFADSLRNLRGELSANALISRKNNERNIDISLKPSSVSSNETVWSISTDGINITSKRADIRQFKIKGDSQELFINGVVSANPQDSVYMGLRHFSIAPITQLTSRVGYEVNGYSNGYAMVHSALKDTRIDARIELDSLNVSGVDIPDLLLSSQWDFGRSRATLDISTRANNKRVIQGYFVPEQRRYYARMQTGGVKLKLLDPVLNGIITNTAGTADVDLTLIGEKRVAELQGSIEVDSLATTIGYTQCRYTVPKASIKVSNNHLIAKDIPIFDKKGSNGKMSVDVSLAHLSNIEYDVDLQIRNMAVLNTTERDNPMFYGSLFASGTGSIRGDKAGVKMDFAARSGDNSKFFMPLTDHKDMSSANFVTFATKDLDTTSYLVRKKMMFENRQKRRTSSEGSMDISLALDVRPNTEVQLVIDPTVGDIIKSKGEGLLNLRINPQANIFEMYGDYTIQKGSYLFTLQNVINKWFDIEPGSTIQWTGEPLDAILNINAVYKLKASLQPLLEGSLTENNRSSRAVPVECFIHLTDRLTQPTVNFDIVVPNADSEVQNLIASSLSTPESKSQQFLYLILANSFISESQNSMSGSIGASATAATGFELLSNQFSNWLSSEDYKIVLRYRPRTEQMSDEVDFGFSKGLINNRLLIEVEGNYIVDKAQVVNANSNFTGEAYLTWLIDRAGVLRLKGFTHTIDRFDENQGLQETGIGIYFKEDFNNAKDLRIRLKNRFKREKKDDEEEDTPHHNKAVEKQREEKLNKNKNKK